MVDLIVEEGALKLADGGTFAGVELRNLIEVERKLARLAEPLSKHTPMKIVENAALCGMFSENADLAGTSAAVAKRMDTFEKPHFRGLSAEAFDGGVKFKRRLRGVDEEHILRNTEIQSSEARRMNEVLADIKSVFAGPAKLVLKDREYDATLPVEMLSKAFEAGKFGLAISRYKGLGEMNA